jgi:hypothetical protein
MLYLAILPSRAWAGQRMTVAAVLRNHDGEWAAINDKEHQPINVASITSTKDSITLTFEQKAKLIHTFIVVPDESFAGRNKLVCGASVGISYAVIKCGEPGKPGYANLRALDGTNSNLWVYGLFSK